MYEFKTEGMSCSSCVRHVTNAVASVDPKARVQVDLSQQKITVESAKDAKSLAAAIEEAGYPIQETRTSAA